MLQHTYDSTALSFVKTYSDAESNDLVYDRHQEELTVRYFRNYIAPPGTRQGKRRKGPRFHHGTGLFTLFQTFIEICSKPWLETMREAWMMS
jgi:hypothetical protein